MSTRKIFILTLESLFEAFFVYIIASFVLTFLVASLFPLFTTVEDKSYPTAILLLFGLLAGVVGGNLDLSKFYFPWTIPFAIITALIYGIFIFKKRYRQILENKNILTKPQSFIKYNIITFIFLYFLIASLRSVGNSLAEGDLVGLVIILIFFVAAILPQVKKIRKRF